MADVQTFTNWSSNSANNFPTGGTIIGSGADDNFREIQAQTAVWRDGTGYGILTITSVAGSNSITGSTSPAPTLSANQKFLLLPALANSGPTFLNLNGGGNKAVFSGGFTCAGGELAAAIPTLLEFDGTQYNILSGAPFSDAVTLIYGSGDSTKRMRFELDTNVPTGTTLVITPGANTILPPGMIMPYAGSSVPTGWLYCDGSAVSRTTYAALFTAIGTNWGAGDGSTTFNVPNLLGKHPLGDGQNVVSESVAASGVSAAADTMAVSSNNAKWITGQTVRLSSTSSLPGGVSAATDYFVIRSSATLIQLATTLANAQNGTALDITSQGAGTHTITTSGATAQSYQSHTLAEVGGEEKHAQAKTELVSHTHNIDVNGGAGGSLTIATGTFSIGTLVSEATGGNNAANVLSPFAVVKYIIST